MKRVHVDVELVSQSHVRSLKEILFREYARQTLGPDTDPDVEFTNIKISASVIDGPKKPKGKR